MCAIDQTPGFLRDSPTCWPRVGNFKAALRCRVWARAGCVWAARALTLVPLQVLLVQGVSDGQVGEEALVLLLQLSDLAEQILSFSPPDVLHQLQLLKPHITLCYCPLTPRIPQRWGSQTGSESCAASSTSCPVWEHLSCSSRFFQKTCFPRCRWSKVIKEAESRYFFLHYKLTEAFPASYMFLFQPRLPRRRVYTAVAAQTLLFSDLATESQSQETYSSTIFIAQSRGDSERWPSYLWHLQCRTGYRRTNPSTSPNPDPGYHLPMSYYGYTHRVSMKLHYYLEPAAYSAFCLLPCLKNKVCFSVFLNVK